MIDDFDELASAYLDGQATPDEVARVEADPELRARVDALQAVAGQLADAELAGPAPETRERHLAAALAAFDLAVPVAAGSPADAAADAGDSGPGVVEVEGARIIDLSDRRPADAIEAPPPMRTPPDRAAEPERGVASVSSLDTAAGSRRRRAAGLPSWLGAAAAAVLVVGGVGVVAANRGSSDEAETASFAVDQGDETTESDEGGAANLASEMLAQDESAPDADDSDAVERATEEAESTSAGAEAATTTVAAESGALSFPAEPSEAELLARRADRQLAAPEVSACGGVVPAPEGGVLAGYVPVEIAGTAGEALVFTLADGSETVVLVTIDCQPF